METKDCSKFKKGTCSSLYNPQPMDNFRPQQGRRRGRSLCMSCEKEYTFKNREKSRIRANIWNIENKVRARENKTLSRYGLKEKDYIKMFNDQDGRCAICKTHQEDIGTTLNVDHCHKTGMIRSLLCHKCNRGLGLFNDDIDKLNRAMEYLKWHTVTL